MDSRTKCAGCGKQILWARTNDGKTIPLDPTPAVYRLVSKGADGPVVTRDLEAFVTHFATCPHANQFSGRNRR